MSNGDKVCIKFVVLDEIYNFAVKNFFIWDSIVSNKQYKVQKYVVN
jgi:hypothetical protein